METMLVNNIPFETDLRDLAREFEQYGRVINCQFHRKPSSDHTGSALVTLDTSEGGKNTGRLLRQINSSGQMYLSNCKIVISVTLR